MYDHILCHYTQYNVTHAVYYLAADNLYNYIIIIIMRTITVTLFCTPWPPLCVQALQDWKLFLVLAAFLLIDVALLTVSSIVPQTRLTAQFHNVSMKGLEWLPVHQGIKWMFRVEFVRYIFHSVFMILCKYNSNLSSIMQYCVSNDATNYVIYSHIQNKVMLSLLLYLCSLLHLWNTLTAWRGTPSSP